MTLIQILIPLLQQRLQMYVSMHGATADEDDDVENDVVMLLFVHLAMMIVIVNDAVWVHVVHVYDDDCVRTIDYLVCFAIHVQSVVKEVD